MISKRKRLFMKYVLIWLLKLYRKIPFITHYRCKFYPTCSMYAIEALEKIGLWKGSFLTIKRVLKCNPWSQGGIDPVPDRH